ncbi:MAG: ATP-binding cassette domain-containing protein [Acidimicrobiales bacterium]
MDSSLETRMCSTRSQSIPLIARMRTVPPPTRWAAADSTGNSISQSTSGVLAVSGVTFHFRGRRDVLHNVDLDVGQGVTALLGPNGAGKTTLMRIVATALRAASGTVAIDGVVPRDHHSTKQYRGRLGWLPQQVPVIPHFTVRELLSYSSWLHGSSARDSDRAAKRVIELLDLGSLSDVAIRKLSGGMVRRVGIAQAIVHHPEVLLLDEPTVGLDPEQRASMRQVIRDLGTTTSVLLSTHLTEDVNATCDRVAVMTKGSVLFRGDVGALAQIGSDSSSTETPLDAGYLQLVNDAVPSKG